MHISQDDVFFEYLANYLRKWIRGCLFYRTSVVCPKVDALLLDLMPAIWDKPNSWLVIVVVYVQW